MLVLSGKPSKETKKEKVEQPNKTFGTLYGRYRTCH